MLGAFTENGPYWFRFNSTARNEEKAYFEYNKFSWNNNAHVLFVDQPLGTGFSFIEKASELRTNTHDISVDFYNFLQNFYIKYPQFKNRELYLTGESFAGHYIPAIANYLHLETNI
jgi:carboxypeptidase C (cathepsin A)